MSFLQIEYCHGAVFVRFSIVRCRYLSNGELEIPFRLRAEPESRIHSLGTSPDGEGDHSSLFLALRFVHLHRPCIDR